MKIRYDLDRAADGQKFTGGTDLAGALMILLRDSGVLQGGTGYLYKDSAPKAALRFAAAEECGIYLGITAGETVSLSLADADALAECVDLGGDEMLVSRGLFLAPQEALRAIRRFAETGAPDPAIQWISPEKLPEDGNYII